MPIASPASRLAHHVLQLHSIMHDRGVDGWYRIQEIMRTAAAIDQAARRLHPAESTIPEIAGSDLAEGARHAARQLDIWLLVDEPLSGYIQEGRVRRQRPSRGRAPHRRSPFPHRGPTSRPTACRPRSPTRCSPHGPAGWRVRRCPVLRRRLARRASATTRYAEGAIGSAVEREFE